VNFYVSMQRNYCASWMFAVPNWYCTGYTCLF